MIYIFLFLVFIGISLILLASFIHFKDKKQFRGDRLSETPIFKKILDNIVPNEKSAEYRIKSNLIFVFNRNFSVRDFYFAKIFIFLGAVVLSVVIVASNMFSRYEEALDVSSKTSITISSSEYNYLVSGLKFVSKSESMKDYHNDLSVLDANISTLPEEDSREKFSKMSTTNLYQILEDVNDKMGDVFSFLDLILVLGLLVLAWVGPDEVLKRAFKSLAGKSVFEFDELQSTIMLNTHLQTLDLLEVLIENASYYRNILREFRDSYEADPKKSKEVVMFGNTFTNNVKELVRYLDILDTEGPEACKFLVSVKKEQGQQLIRRTREALIKSRRNKVKVLCIVGFLIVVVRVIVSLFAGAV